ncbi:iron chaperone [Microbacterium sediminis]|uniref:Uncharacterized protein n=1 Tax=Microbacterium sediminis TaxID=904291 RepID=A0A1B9NGN5_9MICO|nr:DUF1801 domain-containing protein [Microbacterium sediminis]OCG75740.1 hypothetical protein A7J15_01440 [Microbacterium sediminis]QBR74134.1 DUF1801 domain-containing protein [Microbacterium sediminis]
MATSEGLTAEEREAIKETAKERRRPKKNDAEALAQAIADMPEGDRAIAERVRALVTEHAPELAASTWYGMPAWKNAKGKVVVFFQAAAKFKARYATIGFDEAAAIDEGTMWPVSFAVTELTAADEDLLAALIRKAVS